MDANVYAPPVAVVMDAPSHIAAPEFYVVARTKFFVLFFVTMGLYQLYWFYRHWARYRGHHRVKVSPIWRAIFAIFFTHSLCREIGQSLARAGTTYRWSPALLASGFVLLQIVSLVSDRLAAYEIGSPYTDLLALAVMVPVAYCMWWMQKAANLACSQPNGESNREFTWANWVWIVLGGLWWLLVLVAIAMLLEWYAIPVELE